MPTLTGLFESQADAERAVETLVQQLGLARERIQVKATGEAPRGAPGGTPAILVSLLVPDDRAAAARDALTGNGGRAEDPDTGA